MATWHVVGTKSLSLSVSGVQTTVANALMTELKKWYKKNVDVPGVTEAYDWSFDVTQAVINSGLVQDVSKAYIYGWYRINGYSYAGTTRPPERSDADKVRTWLSGVEKALFYLGSDTYVLTDGSYGYYWADVPVKLVVVKKTPSITWSVNVPPSVQVGKSFNITVNVSSSRQIPVRVTVSLFGQTQTKEATAPAPLTFTFTAPTKAGTYTGSIKLEAYY